MKMLLFKEQLELIYKVTEMLNSAEIPDSDSHHIKVLLMKTDTDSVVGVWDDEISSDDWSLELSGPTDEDPKSKP